MGLHRDPQRVFEQRLRLVLAAGIELPAAVTALQARAKAEVHRAHGTPVRDRLTTALIDGDPTADYPILWAAALAEANEDRGLRRDLAESVRANLNTEIRRRYSETAEANYLAIGALFDTHARGLHAAANVVDVELPAALVVTAPDKQRTAWRAAQTHAAELDRLGAALHAAAALAHICDDNPDNLLPLTVDTTELPRRDVWAAWEIQETRAQVERAEANHSPFTTDAARLDPLRCGRWSALLRVGAQLRACAPGAFTEYRRPRPRVERRENTPAGPVTVWSDPESPDYTEPEPETFTPPQRLVRSLR